MPESGSQPEWDEVLRAVQALADRVARIEQDLQLPQHAAIPSSAAAATEPARTAFAEGANAVPIAGRCLLGLAGAYLLRAITESQMLPSKPGVFAAILYAVAWLVWAARVAAGRRAETVLYSLTSALVLGPLLWESTLRFHAISTWTAASVLLVFTVFGLMISWHKSLLVVATIATLTGVLTAVALLIGSHDVVPFMLLLLAIAAAVEISACLEHWLSERWLTATAADLAVLLATYLVTNERGFPETYVPISHFTLLAAQLGLLTIYLGSTMVRTLLRGFSFTGFETVQLALAFSVGLGGGLRLRGDPHTGLTMDAAFLVCAVACYAAAFAQRGRNFLTYAWVGCLLVLAGTSIALPPGAAAAVWCVLAISELGARSVALRWQGCFYLLCGVATSGGLADAKDFILGGADSTAALWPALGAAAAAFACYTLATRGVLASRMLAAILAATAFWLAGGVSAAVLTRGYHGLFGALAPHAYCATLRTAVLAGGAGFLAWAGAHWKRQELSPIVFLVMGLGAYRLLLVDLQQDGKAPLIFSLLVYGVALMLLPRLMQSRRAATNASAAPARAGVM
jgi:hypothetical protein